MQEIYHRDSRTGIETVVRWYLAGDGRVTASYYRKDGSFIKSEVLGYANTEAGFQRLVERNNLD